MAFHEIQFPTSISRGSSGGPRRFTDIVTLRSGHEERNSIWLNSRRIYDAGLGLRDINDVYDALAFFEGRRGRLHGFRWKDWSDYKSGKPGDAITDTDQTIGTGDGSVVDFQLVKSYDSVNPYSRDIKKPVASTIEIALDGISTSAFSVDTTTGIVTMDSPPGVGVSVSAGFEFDVPVRFDTEELLINVDTFMAGTVPAIPIIEVRK